MNKTGLLTLTVLFLLLVMLAGAFVGSYNRLQKMDENVNSKWAQVNNQLKRRNDLIPNLVATVKGYAAHEKEVFSNIADARAKLGGAMKNSDMKGISRTNAELTGALSRLLLIVERYPQLKADRQFINLQDELAGTENRLSVARKDYNESVQNINALIRTFPTSIVAMISGIKSRDYFEVDEADKKTPEVKF